MHRTRTSSGCVCHILPPHVLRNISQNGTPKQRSKAMRTLSTDHTLRAMRAAAPRQRLAARLAAPSQTAEKARTIFDCAGSQDLPGNLVRGEKGPKSSDVAVNEAYDGLGSTFDFFSSIFDRNSIDDEGLPLNASVHFGDEYDNAFWDGERMVFGDGDGEIFNRFTVALDIIGHELAHGVTEDEAGLLYFFQSGALNESMSDVFGSLIKQYQRRQTADKADWLIGEGLLAGGVNGQALRSLKAPGTAFDDPVLGKDPQPANMENFVRTFEDNGGVHINSGIPNHAFYLLATSLGGNAWEKPGRIWYDTLRDSRVRPNTGFRRFASLTLANAERLYPGGVEAKAVRDAWQRVGLKIS